MPAPICPVSDFQVLGIGCQLFVAYIVGEAIFEVLEVPGTGQRLRDHARRRAG